MQNASFDAMGNGSMSKTEVASEKKTVGTQVQILCLLSFASSKMLKCVNMGFVTIIWDLVKKLC